MKNSTLTALALACTLLASVGTSLSAHAAPTLYFGENLNPMGAVSGDPLTARNSFLSQLTGVGTDGFETQARGTTTPLALTFAGSAGDITATLTGAGDVADATTDVNAGRFNTSAGGKQWRRVSGDFEINFSTAISAFGFYGTDIGDFNGKVTIDLTDTNNNVTNYLLDTTLNGPNGSLLFWGFIDTTTSYTKIAFGNTNAGTDFFGFDDMTIGDRQQVRVPEPASLALVGLSLLALTATRRRRRG